MSSRRLLLPLTPVYRLAVAARELRLRRGWERVRRLRYPVISIGNLSTGGSGKTPFVIALAKALAVRGLAVDVLSRGYGREGTAPAQVDPEGNPAEFGDEPLLIARQAGVPVFVASERYEAGVLAEESQNLPSGAKAHVHPDSENVRAEARTLQNGRLHILDDGFQHRQLHRDLNILLLNNEDWHDRLLPAGNLREPLHAIGRAAVIAVPANQAEFEDELRAWGWKGPMWRLRRDMDLPRVDGPVLAFCGIARPQQFFDGLQTGGMSLAGRVVFQDHHRYTPADLERLQARAHSAHAAALITTAKDYVRLAALATSSAPKPPLLTAGLRIEIEEEAAALEWLVARVREADPAAPPL